MSIYIGIVVTTDGSITEIRRLCGGEEKVIKEMQDTGSLLQFFSIVIKWEHVPALRDNCMKIQCPVIPVNAGNGAE